MENLPLLISEVNKKLVQTSESVSDVEANVRDIMVTMRRKIWGKMIHVDITPSHMDIASFYYETSVQKWKYVLQRRIAP